MMAESVTKFDIREILRSRVTREAGFEGAVKTIKAYTLGVDSNETPAVDGREKYIWVREHGLNGAVHQVFNPDSIPRMVNFPCIIKHGPKEPHRWQVSDVDWDEVYNYPSYEGQSFGYGAHADNHEWPDYHQGSDPVNVYPRSLTSFRTYPSGSDLSVNVWAHRYPYKGVLKEFTGVAGVSMLSHQPGSGNALLVLVYLDKENNHIRTVEGTSIGDGATLPPFPAIPDNAILSACVRVDGDQTSVLEADILDLRMTLTESEKTEIAGSTAMTIDHLAVQEAQFDLWFSMHVLTGH